MNKYFQHQQMMIIISQYWNMVHGARAEDVLMDEEGLQIMRTPGRNMACFLRFREAGERAGVRLPLPYTVFFSMGCIMIVFGGRVCDLLPPRLSVIIGGIMMAGGFLVSGFMASPVLLTIFFGLAAGTGEGFLYAAATPTAVKWFPQRL